MHGLSRRTRFDSLIKIQTGYFMDEPRLIERET